MPTNSSAREGRKNSGGDVLKKTVANAVSPETLLDLASRLGVYDMVVDKLRARLEEVDIDELLDEIGAYLKRNPEVIVVGLGTVTVMAGILVFLERRGDDGRDEGRSEWIEPEPRTASRPRAATPPRPQRRRAS